MANPSSLRAAELSTLSNLSYATKLSAVPYGWDFQEKYSNPGSGGFSYITLRRGNEIVVAFKGTNSFADLGADISIVAGSWNDYYEQAAKIVSEIRSEFGGAYVTVTGHSLGGAIAQVISKMYRLGGASFEAPGAEAATQTEGYRLAQQKYASGLQGSEPETFVNYIANGSLISGVQTHVGERIAMDPYGETSVTKVLSIFGLFFGGPVTLLSFVGLGISNINRLHPINGIEKTLWTQALLEKELSIEWGDAQRDQDPSLRRSGTAGARRQPERRSHRIQGSLHWRDSRDADPRVGRLCASLWRHAGTDHPAESR